MNREKFVKAIIEEINCFSSDQLVQLNNWYCDEQDCPDDQIYSNDANFFADYFSDTMEAVRAVSYGDYHYTHDWVKFNGYGNLETMDQVGEDDLTDSIENIAEEIADNFHNYDHLFDIDPDDFNIEYPFEEGDDYWTIEDGKIVHSCWDEESEEMHTEDKVYFSSEEEAREYLNDDEGDEDDDTHLEP